MSRAGLCGVSCLMLGCGELGGCQWLLGLSLLGLSNCIAWDVVAYFDWRYVMWLDYFRSDFGGFFLSSSSFIVFVALYIKARAASAIDESSALSRRFSSCRFFI